MESRKGKMSLFRSPSIYEEKREDQDQGEYSKNKLKIYFIKFGKRD